MYANNLNMGMNMNMGLGFGAMGNTGLNSCGMNAMNNMAALNNFNNGFNNGNVFNAMNNLNAYNTWGNCGNFSLNNNWGLNGLYGYRQMNWNNYNMQCYNIPEMWVMNQGLMAFTMFDRNGSGFIDMMELPAVLNYCFQQLGIGMPTMQDVYYAMFLFDTNEDGRLSRLEFTRMLNFMGGRGRNNLAGNLGFGIRNNFF